MTWTDEDERKFQERKANYLAQEEAASRERHTDPTRTKCPRCGSGDYIETARVEECNHCGYSQSY